jgi:hypothetical protein
MPQRAAWRSWQWWSSSLEALRHAERATLIEQLRAEVGVHAPHRSVTLLACRSDAPQNRADLHGGPRATARGRNTANIQRSSDASM